MEKRLFYLIILFCTVSLASCEPEVVQRWDYSNDLVAIIVENANGDDLLNDDVEGNILANTIKVTYDGKTYTLSGSWTRAEAPVLPVWKGLQYGISHDTRRNCQMLLGEFSIDTRDYRDEPFSIDWGDGTTSEVKFDLYATPNGKNERPTVHQATWLKDAQGEWKVNSPNTLVVSIIK